MKDHAQYADALALYAMNALDDRQELAELQGHLGTCGECRRELEALRADTALLALSATGPQPPQRARLRLIQAVAAEPRQGERQKTQVVGRLRSRWFTLAPIAAAIILAIASFSLLREVQGLKDRNASLTSKVEDLSKQNEHARAVLELLQNPKAEHMTLVAAKTPPASQMKTMYDREKGRVLLFASNVAPLPDDKVYELWLIPMNGAAPMPAGTFSPDRFGGGMIMHQFDTQGIQAKMFAVTIEPRGGSQTPTMPIVMAPPS
jgi:FtsZ-binding cell division protein ZapB